MLRLPEPQGGVPAGKYLVDDQGKIRYLEDPGINGQVETRDSGEKVEKYNAPKAMLMSFIIDGIMSHKLPWSLVLIGVFISVLLELLGLSSLAFAVGVYLPVSTSIPIMIGGVVRWARGPDLAAQARPRPRRRAARASSSARGSSPAARSPG